MVRVLVWLGFPRSSPCNSTLANSTLDRDLSPVRLKQPCLERNSPGQSDSGSLFCGRTAQKETEEAERRKIQPSGAGPKEDHRTASFRCQVAAKTDRSLLSVLQRKRLRSVRLPFRARPTVALLWVARLVGLLRVARRHGNTRGGEPARVARRVSALRRSRCTGEDRMQTNKTGRKFLVRIPIL